MMNRAIEGVLVEAKLRGGLFGQLSYEQVTVLQADGREVALGSVAVAADLRDTLVIGTHGRFFFHDVVGFKGLHGFKSADGSVRTAFPRLIEDAFGALTMINLVMMATMLTFDGELRLLPAMMAALGATSWMIFAASRQAIVHDFNFESGIAKAARTSAAKRPRHQLV